jgi:hypothetical protein
MHSIYTFCCDQTKLPRYNPCGSLLRNSNVHCISEELTSLQHNVLTVTIQELMKTQRSSLLAWHHHSKIVNFAQLGSGPTLARQVWAAKYGNGYQRTQGNFCTQETICLLRTPIAASIIRTQFSPPTTGGCSVPPLLSVIPHVPNPSHLFSLRALKLAILVCPRLRTQSHTITIADQPHLKTTPFSLFFIVPMHNSTHSPLSNVPAFLSNYCTTPLIRLVQPPPHP